MSVRRPSKGAHPALAPVLCMTRTDRYTYREAEGAPTSVPRRGIERHVYPPWYHLRDIHPGYTSLLLLFWTSSPTVLDDSGRLVPKMLNFILAGLRTDRYFSAPRGVENKHHFLSLS